MRDRERAGNTSAPVDLDQVTACLLEWADGNTSPTQTRHPLSHGEISPSPQLSSNDGDDHEPPEAAFWEEKTAAWARADERAFHDELVNDGGRPWYQIGLLDDVMGNPAKHRGILSFWGLGRTGVNSARVFGGQLMRWRYFRMWQKDNRGICDDKAEFAEHIESAKAPRNTVRGDRPAIRSRRHS